MKRKNRTIVKLQKLISKKNGLRIEMTQIKWDVTTNYSVM